MGKFTKWYQCFLQFETLLSPSWLLPVYFGNGILPSEDRLGPLSFAVVKYTGMGGYTPKVRNASSCSAVTLHNKDLWFVTFNNKCSKGSFTHTESREEILHFCVFE
ncbi:hypothetical protein CDAR_43161 [Caerostris darwini]|uniref:LAGLIDADG homing endonuclease n=1 Tax=Caerostris darwini TaxID=1538125 RepID=A0AAV4WGJ8_9ARAC|nr:hypothetical protein CDAR_43161 [Caerostris darwini]